METGTAEVNSLMGLLKDTGVHLGHQRALDYGCGAGRVTQALAGHFERVDGVDISPEMVSIAHRLAAGNRRLDFQVTATSDLAQFESGTFDLVFCSLVLQHLRETVALRLVGEFVRVLAPGGIAAFQAPGAPGRSWPGLLARVLPPQVLNVVRRRRFGWEIHMLSPTLVAEAVERAGGAVLAVQEFGDSGPSTRSYRYVVGRPAGPPESGLPTRR